MAIKILHIITTLGSGGAEKVLYELITLSPTENFEHIVISLGDLDFYGKRLLDAGIKVHTLRLSIKNPWGIFKLISILKSKSRPAVIQSWLYHGDLISIIARLLGHKNIVWNIRNNKLCWQQSKVTYLVRKVCAWLSFIPKKIICCANIARIEHIRIGYNQEKFITIANGYNLEKFIDANNESRDAIRRGLGINENEFVIGNVARFDVVKGHQNLFEALAMVKKMGLKFKLMLIGSGIDLNNSLLLSWLGVHKIELDEVLLMGQLDDVYRYYQAMDIFVLSSISEAFPNVVCEAMASGRPCVVTDVGDAALIVADSGIVVPPQEPSSLAAAMASLIKAKPSQLDALGDLARQRVSSNFSIARMINNYETLYFELAKFRN